MPPSADISVIELAGFSGRASEVLDGEATVTGGLASTELSAHPNSISADKIRTAVFVILFIENSSLLLDFSTYAIQNQALTLLS